MTGDIDMVIFSSEADLQHTLAPCRNAGVRESDEAFSPESGPPPPGSTSSEVFPRVYGRILGMVILGYPNHAFQDAVPNSESLQKRTMCQAASPAV